MPFAAALLSGEPFCGSICQSYTPPMAKATARRPVTAKTVFAYAEAYAEAAVKVIDQAKRLPSGAKTRHEDAADFVPMVTLDSFAVELYLKCLHLIDHGKAPRGHKYRELFDALRPGTQKAVQTVYIKRLSTEPIAAQFAKDHPRIPMGLNHVLDASSTTFESIRYLYEGKLSATFYWPVLRLALRDTIIAIHPEWKKPAR